jgi:hypothetical protein
MSEHTVNGILALRQLHLQSIAQIWAERKQIDTFIEEYSKRGSDENAYQWTNPLTLFPDAYWAQLVVETGPRNREKKVSKDNPYYFWAEGVAPFFDFNNGRYMVQPYANNRIYVSVPKKLQGQADSPELAAKAIASYFVSAPGLFSTLHPEAQKNLTYKEASGAKTMGDLDAVEAMFGIESGLFIAMTTRYISAKHFNFNSLRESITHLLAAGAEVETSFNLSDNASLYHAFGAAMQNLIALMWTSEPVRLSVITDPADLARPLGHVPGSTIQLFKELVGYDYPFFMDLILLEDTEASFHAEVWARNGSTNGEVKITNPGSSDYKKLLNRWVWTYSKARIDSVIDSGIEAGKFYLNPKFPLQTLELMVPMQPDIKENSAVALTRYNVDSSGYPFSC